MEGPFRKNGQKHKKHQGNLWRFDKGTLLQSIGVCDKICISFLSFAVFYMKSVELSY